MVVYMVIHRDKPAAKVAAAEAANILHEAGIKVLLNETFPPLGGNAPMQALPAQQAEEMCDVVLCIGGDGTMLHAARSAMLLQKPLLGVNVGRLGFLAILERNELYKLRRLSTGNYAVEQRRVLRADLGEQDTAPRYALNEVVLLSNNRINTLSLELHCDDALVSGFLGDGVIFSTPTGSTAYSMSAGGPIVDAQLGAIVISQICPHVGRTPALVISDERVVHILPREGCASISMICDGISEQTVSQDGVLRISKSNYTVPMIQFSPIEQLEIVNCKLTGR